MAILRRFFIWLDQVAFGFIDEAYNLILGFATGEFITADNVIGIIRNMYVIVGIVALFRIAILLINALIDPDKLFEKGKGLGNILIRTVIMLVMLVVSPFLFEEVFDIQNHVMNSNIIPKLIVGSETNNVTGESAGKQMRNIALSALVTVNHKFVLKVDSVTGTPLTDSEQQNPGDKKFVYLYEMIYDSQGKPEKIYDDEGNIIQNPSFNEENAIDKTGGYLYNDTTCTTDNCKRAINKYNKLYMSGDMDISELKKYINTSVKIPIDSNGDETTEEDATSYETEYVYDYMVLLTTVTGVFITYILFSFALDIAIRVFELAALQILSPLFIVTFVDPKSASSGPFNRWIKAFGNSYAGLFIRIAIVCLLIFLISWVNNYDILENTYLANQSGLAKLLLIWGVLAFAKKAPKWISDMIGIQSDGLGSLGIGKKLTSGALGGALLAKGAKGLAGASLATGKNLMNQQRHRRKQLKAAKKDNPHLFGNTEEGREYRKRRNKENYNNIRAQNKGISAAAALAQARRQTERDIKDEMKKVGLNAGTGVAQIASAVINGAGAFSAAANADKLSGSLKVASDRSKNFKDTKGMLGESWFEKAKTGITRQGVKLTDKAWGDEGAIYERSDKLAKEKARKLNHTKEALDKYGDSLYNGMGSFSQSIQTSDGTIAKNIEDAKAIYGAKLSGVSDIKYENGKLMINGSDSLSGFVNVAQDALSGHGKVDFLDKFNKTQNTSVSEYQENLQQQQNIAQSIAPLKQMLDETVKNMQSSFNNIKLPDTLNGKIELNSNGTFKINSEDFDFQKLSQGLENWKNSSDGSDEKALFQFFESDEGKSMLKTMEQCAGYESTITAQEENITKFATRNSQLVLNVEGVQDKVNIETGLLERESDGTIKKDPRATTLAGALNVIAQDRDTISKKLASADKQAEKEGQK